MKGLVIVTMLAAAAEPASPPKVTVSPPPAPTVVLAPPPPMIIRADYLSITPVDVVVTAGREVLWSGSLRVNNSGANYSQSLRQADEPCASRGPVSDGTRYNESQYQLNFNISRRGGRDLPDSFSVSVRWTRPAPTCEGGGNRGVSLDQQVEIAPGQTVRLTGDAGLAVTLTRRAR